MLVLVAAMGLARQVADKAPPVDDHLFHGTNVKKLTPYCNVTGMLVLVAVCF